MEELILSSIECTMFPHHSIHKYTWISPDSKMPSQTDQVLMDKKWHSCIVHVWSLIVDCHTDDYLVVAEVRERLSASEQHRSLI
jgi:hypothetical protein